MIRPGSVRFDAILDNYATGHLVAYEVFVRLLPLFGMWETADLLTWIPGKLHEEIERGIRVCVTQERLELSGGRMEAVHPDILERFRCFQITKSLPTPRVADERDDSWMFEHYNA